MNARNRVDNPDLKRDTKRVSDAITHYKYIESPVGKLLLAGTYETLMLINFSTGSQARRPNDNWILDNNYFSQATQQLNEYFLLSRTEFSIPVEMDGTEFQIQAWAALRKVPYGATISYGELARKMGRPNASRAVGAANHANPLPIVVPCHRVIGADKSLTGFGGGLDTKRWLLEMEARRGSSNNQQGDLFARA